MKSGFWAYIYYFTKLYSLFVKYDLASLGWRKQAFGVPYTLTVLGLANPNTQGYAQLYMGIPAGFWVCQTQVPWVFWVNPWETQGISHFFGNGYKMGIFVLFLILVFFSPKKGIFKKIAFFLCFK